MQENIDITFVSWKYTSWVPTVIFPSAKQSCQPQSAIRLVLISEKQSLQSLWNHQVGHSTTVAYLPWSWWAILSLRGFSVLEAVAIYSASLSKRFDMPLKENSLFLFSLFASVPPPLPLSLCCGYSITIDSQIIKWFQVMDWLAHTVLLTSSCLLSITHCCVLLGFVMVLPRERWQMKSSRNWFWSTKTLK